MWIDRRLGTVMVFLVLGMILGMTTAILHLVRLGTIIEQKGPLRGRAVAQPDKKRTGGASGQSMETDDRTEPRPDGT